MPSVPAGDQLRDRRVRLAAFQFLEEQTARHGDLLDWKILTHGFQSEGRTVPLLGASGIWKPAVLDAPISLTTTPPKPGKPAPYEDEVGPDGLLRYRYQGTDTANHFNVGLRTVFRERLPVIYFHGVAKGRYTPFWPCFVVADDPGGLSVSVELNDAAVTGIDLALSDDDEVALDRAYARRLTVQRLHQAGFRARVMRAYRNSCAICRLRRVELLDAAHIVPDRHDRGVPSVPNGMALCKIHHAAFDAHLLGVRPDHVIEVRADVLRDSDGPMLRHGLQEHHNQALILPTKKSDRPGPEFLEIRYDQFRRAG